MHWPYAMPGAPAYPNTCAGRGGGTRHGEGRLVRNCADVLAASSVTSGYTCVPRHRPQKGRGGQWAAAHRGVSA